VPVTGGGAEPDSEHPERSEGWNLGYSEVAPAMVMIALPFSVLGGPVLGCNVSLLISFVLSGLGVYVWVRRRSGNTAAATMQLMGTQWLPFFFMSLDSLMDGSPRPRRDVFLCVTSLGLIAFTWQFTCT
jgi:hypothetical protein